MVDVPSRMISYLHDELVWCDNTPDRKQSMAVWRREAGFQLKEYERDRDGTWVDEIPDGNDHSIDSVRYAMMDDVLRG